MQNYTSEGQNYYTHFKQSHLGHFPGGSSDFKKKGNCCECGREEDLRSKIELSLIPVRPYQKKYGKKRRKCKKKKRNREREERERERKREREKERRQQWIKTK